jgi:methyl-accepting chemotaxis protein
MRWGLLGPSLVLAFTHAFIVQSFFCSNHRHLAHGNREVGMNWLARARLRVKLALLMGLSALALLIIAVIAGSMLHRSLYDGRIDKLRAVVDGSVAVAKSLDAQVSAGKMTREQAVAGLRQTIHGLRFDGGDGYVVVSGLDDGITSIHGADASREQQKSPTVDSKGHTVHDLVTAVLKGADTGIVSYSFPKPGHTEPQQKLVYVEGYPPLHSYFLAGAWVDDIDAQFRRIVWQVSGVGAAVLASLLLACWVVARDISRPLAALTAAMRWLAQGDLKLDIPGCGRRDEAGEMAQAVQVFKDGMIEAERLREEQEQQKGRAEAERRQAMLKLADTFEAGVRGIVNAVASQATEMQASAQAMTHTAEEATKQATAVAAAGEQASANVQTVASSTEELSASVAEISRQVQQSSKIAGQAVAEAGNTSAIVEGLNKTAQHIGEVVQLIESIAGQTNLLALNATIEAARAGDAGKGFAVVASEVKSLAGQTAKATDDIKTQVTEIQAATAQTVDAIKAIGETIGRMNEIATMIASAVEEQGAATREIAGSVQQAAQGTGDIATNIAGVSQAAGETGAAATQVLGAAAEMSKQSEALRRDVDSFLATVRAA